jgi:GAF domain-containing protein
MNYRSIVAVPMLKDDRSIGAIAIAQSQTGHFPAWQIELLRTFANQAVIAIENARLFEEVQTRTKELTKSVEELRALGEVGQAINSTLDVEAVLARIVAKAVQLSGTEAGTIYTFDELRREFQLRATHGMDESMIAAIRDRSIGCRSDRNRQSSRRTGAPPDSGCAQGTIFSSRCDCACGLSIDACCAAASSRSNRWCAGGSP